MKPKAVTIKEVNYITHSFDTVHTCLSTELPTFFKPLQSILEENDVTALTIQIQDVHYLIMTDTHQDTEGIFDKPQLPQLKKRRRSAEQVAEQVPESVPEWLGAVETAVQLLTGQILNMRTELLVVKAHLNTIAEHLNVTLVEPDE